MAFAWRVDAVLRFLRNLSHRRDCSSDQSFITVTSSTWNKRTLGALTRPLGLEDNALEMLRRMESFTITPDARTAR
jgi:hypothetical protein